MDVTDVIRYEPMLHFARTEHFYPMSVDEFVVNCSLHALEGDQGIMYVPPGYVALEDLTTFASQDHYLVYADRRVEDVDKAQALVQWIERQKTVKGPDFSQFKHEIKEKAELLGVKLAHVFGLFGMDEKIFDQALANYGQVTDHTPTYYYKITRPEGTAGYWSIQYWYFYAYNDFATNHGGANDHEGDWECVHLLFSEDKESRWAVYSSHGGSGSENRRPWQPAELTLEGKHPVVYVGGGSHANYFTPELKPLEQEMFKPGIAIGETGDLTWGEPQPLNRPWFENYIGRWGARQWDKQSHMLIDAIGGPPTGPKYNRDGNERDEWKDPAKYAGLVKKGNSIIGHQEPDPMTESNNHNGGDYIVTGDITNSMAVAIGRNAQAIVYRIEQGDFIEHQEIVNINLNFGKYAPIAQERLLKDIMSHLELDRGSVQNAVMKKLPDDVSRQIRELAAAEREMSVKGVPTTPKAAYDLGMMAAYRREYETALDYFRKATESAPAFSEAYKAISWLQQNRALHDFQFLDQRSHARIPIGWMPGISRWAFRPTLAIEWL